MSYMMIILDLKQNVQYAKTRYKEKSQDCLLLYEWNKLFCYYYFYIYFSFAISVRYFVLEIQALPGALWPECVLCSPAVCSVGMSSELCCGFQTWPHIP